MDFDFSIDVNYGGYRISSSGPDTISFGGMTKEEMIKEIRYHCEYVISRLERIND